MDKQIILRIISAVVGLALVAFGVWMAISEGSHAEALIMAGIAFAGGLGTVGLPRLTEPAAPSSRRPRTPPLPVLLALALIVPLGVGCAGAGQAAGAVIAAAPKIRDVSCNGARLVARWMDRACRATGGPPVIPDAAECSSEQPLAPEPENDTGGGEVPVEE